MDVPIGRETSAQRTARLTLERIIEALDDQIIPDAGPNEYALRELRDEAHTALIMLRTEDPTVRVVRADGVERMDGDGRGVLIFLKSDDDTGGIGPILLLHPEVVRDAHDTLARARPRLLPGGDPR